jgi:hypothetical protein
MMGQTDAFFAGGLGGAEVHAAIYGHRIATDDLASEALAEGQRKRCFAAAGGAEEEKRERGAVWKVSLRG